jgi:formate hydrogenlyase subunit 6/NADH:ubiquinone oxidoreductase subunit I
VQTNPETCKGCGLCTERCPMDALQLEVSEKAPASKTGKVAVLNPDLCIGCGVCAYKCPTKSLVLAPREVVQDPPRNARDYTRQVVADFASGWDRLRKESVPTE